MLNAVENLCEPRQGVFFDIVNCRQSQLAQAPICDVANVGLNFLRCHAIDRTEFKSQLDELVFQTHNRLAAVDDVILHRLREAARLVAEGMKHADHRFTMQAFVTHRPRYDLAHALHFVLPREIQQHRKASEQL